MRPTSSVVATLALAACSASEPDRYTVEDYWKELARAHCGKMQGCCTPAEFRDWWTTGDGELLSCTEAHGAPYERGDILEGIRERRIIFDEDAAHACIDALAAQACTVFQQAYRFRETYCPRPPLVGTLRDLDACSVDEECESGACDAGQCVPVLGENAPCGEAPGRCADPLRCNVADDVELRCTLGAPAGTSCFSDDQCADAWCQDGDIFESGTCRAACDG